MPHKQFKENNKYNLLVRHVSLYFTVMPHKDEKGRGEGGREGEPMRGLELIM